MLSKEGSILISLLFLRCRWWARIDSQDVIISKTGMNVNMKMRYLLKCCLADRVPKTQALVRKYCADRAGDPRHRRHESSPGRIIQFAHISEVTTRNDQHVTGMKLSKINECNGQFVLMHEARRNPPRSDVAEDAPIVAYAHGLTRTRSATAGETARRCG